jgi:hypothetical protein
MLFLRLHTLKIKEGKIKTQKGQIINIQPEYSMELNEMKKGWGRGEGGRIKVDGENDYQLHRNGRTVRTEDGEDSTWIL